MTRVEQLKQAIEILAASADDQIAYLRKIGHARAHDSTTSEVDELWNIDELGLEFGDISCAIDNMKEIEEITEVQRDCIRHLSESLGAHSGQIHSDFWTIRGLRSDPRWESIRQEAEHCLSNF